MWRNSWRIGTKLFAFLALTLVILPLQAQSDRQAGPADGGAEKPLAKAADRAPRVPVWTVASDLVGELSVMTTQYEDTFAGIGNRRSLGYLELVKANPGVDPWLPGEGTQITLPRRYVLPDAKREGIVINLAEYRLYYFHQGQVQVYPVGVGTEDNPSPLTDARVIMRLESPAWYPPKSVRAEYDARNEYLPRMIPPGPDNPLGPYALLLSEDGYLIHGTNKQFGVGMAVSHGCFRMYNEDIARFIYQVDKGTNVTVIRQPVKIGLRGREIWLEVHRPQETYSEREREQLWLEVTRVINEFEQQHPGVEYQRRAIELAVQQADGLPRMIGEQLTRVAVDMPRDRNDGSSEQAGEAPVRMLF
ncbi:MAG: L,D-transpeptidase family protein [Marinobacter sp.]|uniref:L,D-transpeptidase family protein n=1 Tax=Marinobacter sp. TaxID=50741 RepID=UPI00299D3C55|nr:L,D-transpeptidase family protein [Marinobacter sp.]MDX1634315.1 L,D-transpeptidase family protein [Marinobacter sp.]